MSQASRLRTNTIAVTTKLTASLSQLTQLAQAPTPSPSHEEVSLHTAIEADLTALDALVREIQIAVDANEVPAPKAKQLLRAREESTRLRADYARINKSIQTARDRANLLADVRMDIDIHNTRSRSPQGAAAAGAAADSAYYLQERQSANNAHSVMDSLLLQMSETRDEFMRQRNVLDAVGNRLEATVGRLPGISQVLSKIDQRHRKNALVIATVSLLCLIILWFSV